MRIRCPYCGYSRGTGPRYWWWLAPAKSFCSTACRTQFAGLWWYHARERWRKRRKAITGFITDSLEALAQDDRDEIRKRSAQFEADRKRYLDWLNYRPP